MKQILFVLVAFTLPLFAQAATETWNGDGIQLTLEERLAKVELGCSSGVFLKPSLRNNTSFDALGWLQSDGMHEAPKRSTLFKGTVIDDVLTLTIRDEEGARLEQVFTLQKGPLQPLIKCAAGE